MLLFLSLNSVFRAVFLSIINPHFEMKNMVAKIGASPDMDCLVLDDIMFTKSFF